MFSTVVFKEPFEVDRELERLRLRREWLMSAVRASLSARLACTPNHPPSFAGVSGWAEGVRVLREELLPQGFERSNEGNLPFTVNKSGTMAIAVATGDPDTGTDISPCTKNPKGIRTRNAVAVNQLSLPLQFGDTQVSPEALESIEKRETWILLIHTDMETGAVRSELSLPVNMSAEGRVDDWSMRLILESIPFDGGDIRITGDTNNGPQSPEIIVEVRRRG
jgi:hypothetical protein